MFVREGLNDENAAGPPAGPADAVAEPNLFLAGERQRGQAQDEGGGHLVVERGLDVAQQIS